MKKLSRLMAVTSLISAMTIMAGCTFFPFGNSGQQGDPDDVTLQGQDVEPVSSVEVEPGPELEPAFFSLFEIYSDEIENGYYEYFVDFEESAEQMFEVTYDLYVNGRGDYTWKVYVFDSPINSDNVLEVLELHDPVVINSGEMEVCSGQCIYAVCEGVDEGGPSGRLSAEYVQYGDSWRNVDVIFKCIESGAADSYTKYPYPPHWKIDMFKIYDVTGDGCDDCCYSLTSGSGMVVTQLYVYDGATGDVYTLGEFQLDYIVMGVEDDKLIVKEKSVGELTGSLIETMGTVIFENGELVFVAD